MLIDALDHFSVYKSMSGGRLDIQLDSALLLNDAYLEIGIAFQQFLAVIHGTAAV